MLDKENTRATIWSMVLVIAAMLFSFALACGMPFAALGALAAMVLPMREAFLAAIAGWLANQVVGYGFLGYPTDMTTLLWGIALGLSAIAAVGAARTTLKLSVSSSLVVRALTAFAAALFAQQAIVYGASWPLPSHPSAFSLPVLWEIGWTNALAFATLSSLYWLASISGLAPAPHHARG